MIGNAGDMDMFCDNSNFKENRKDHSIGFVDVIWPKVVDIFYPPPGTILGYEPPLTRLAGKILFRPSELTIWTGFSGHGKSGFMNQVILSYLEQGAQVYIASLEVKNEYLLHKLAIQATCNVCPSIEHLDLVKKWLSDKLWLDQTLGKAKLDAILASFDTVRAMSNASVLIIDSFMKLGIADEDLTGQKEAIDKICDYKNKYNCHVHLVAHPRKGSDEGRKSGKLDVKGSGTITDLADNCITIWRNKIKEEEKVKNSIRPGSGNVDILKEGDGFFICDKQRNGNWEGKEPMWYWPLQYQYVSYRDEKPHCFVNFP